MCFFFQKWDCFGIVPFQDNMQFNSHSFDSISCQFVIPPQFTLKVENSRIIPIQTFQFQCPDINHYCIVLLYTLLKHCIWYTEMNQDIVVEDHVYEYH